MRCSALIKDLEEILSKTVEEVIASPLSLKLLNLYSKLYLNGEQPRWCESCQRDYYNQLKCEGYLKIKLMEEIEKRTCIPAWNGLKYIHKAGRHYNHELITDVEAIDLLERGFLSESDFIKMPEGFNPEDAKVVQEILKETEVKVSRKTKK
jgi:hypothetical protein